MKPILFYKHKVFLILLFVIFIIYGWSSDNEDFSIRIKTEGDISDKELVILKINHFEDLYKINDNQLIYKKIELQPEINLKIERDTNAVYRFIVSNKDIIEVSQKKQNYFYLVFNKNKVENLEISINVDQNIMTSYHDNNSEFNIAFKEYQKMSENIWKDLEKETDIDQQKYISIYEKNANSLLQTIENPAFTDTEKIFLYSHINPEKNKNLIINNIDSLSHNPLVQSLLASFKKQQELYAKVFKINDATFDKENNKIDVLPSADYYLVSFWASWCGPCRKHNQNEYQKLYELSKNNKNKKIVMINISLDENVDAWKKASIKDNILWNNYIDSNHKNSSYYKEYRFTALPTTFLVDKQGNIIKKIDDSHLTELEDFFK